MKVLVVGSGGREHALVWKIASSPKVEKIFCAPGSGGIEDKAETVGIKADDVGALLAFASSEKIGLTVVGPESALVSGIVDAFQKEGLRIFGPTKDLARLEGSKVFAKETMKKFGVPTAAFRVFDDCAAALGYLDSRPEGAVVVKADGLCAGKGVAVCAANAEAKKAVTEMMKDRAFGPAGERVVIEECLRGEEASIIVIADGRNFVSLASSQDHKRAYDGDRGPNTGGMGAYSPAPVVGPELSGRITSEILGPLFEGLGREGRIYKGALYVGIMATDKGPKVLEFNVRFGDPETQAILPRLKTDLVDVMDRAISGDLAGYGLEWDPRPCVSVVLVSGGYPGHYERGIEISGLGLTKKMKDVIVFHAGTKKGLRKVDGEDLYITAGGRVLNVTALGGNLKEAIDNCYAAIDRIKFNGMRYRKDIGYRALGR